MFGKRLDEAQVVVKALARALSLGDLAIGSSSRIWSAEIRAMVQEYVERVTLVDQEIKIVLKKGPDDGARATARDSRAVGMVIKARLPDARPRARKEIIVPGNAGSPPRGVDQALLLTLARARLWMRALRQGEYRDTAEIARGFVLSEPHVRRVLRLSFLAPDIIEAVVDGRQSRSLNVRRLLRGIPLAWPVQRAACGLNQYRGDA